ncbi:hypothetical protein LTR37_021365 [Vermiconidia calcicola]|uniref:Uncharacterized protein n=1 Tax=Vermiconidia calcicola TaxID=1690605 RepID=A0ACC3M9X3_9PEZI|nr:hypothetical protein LTR37_021365 [Vermiconidia calcicola]
MAGSPFIKPEPNDYNAFDPNQYMQFNQNQYNTGHGNLNVNPANLTSNGMHQNYGQQPNMASSFNTGNAGIADDELLDLDFNAPAQQPDQFTFNQGMQNFIQQQQMNQQPNSAVFSQTPDGPPMQSPFNHDGFHYGQFRPVAQQQQFAGGHSMPQQAGIPPHMQHADRKVSNSRSPASPNTPAMNQGQLGDDFNHPGMQQIHHRQQPSMGNGWDSTPDRHSWNDGSPFASPINGPMHNQISEILKHNTHHHKVASSLPTKMEGGAGPAFQSQDAKRRRRRESHNLVERRRRDNINERIQDLGMLVPQHRLEDEKVRKHLQTNAPLSPSIANASSLSPPAASSLLAGPQGKRATSVAGSITQGLPLEEKEKGPNKGDILNGSVAWTRDLMWYMQKKMRQEDHLKQLLQASGNPWPFEQTEDEKRMRSEICEVINKHIKGGDIDEYSRAPGSGLRVPGFTNVAGDSIDGSGNANGYSIHHQQTSPGFQSGGSGMSSGQVSHRNQEQFWNSEFKEEDEYDLDQMQ